MASPAAEHAIAGALSRIAATFESLAVVALAHGKLTLAEMEADVKRRDSRREESESSQRETHDAYAAQEKARHEAEEARQTKYRAEEKRRSDLQRIEEHARRFVQPCPACKSTANAVCSPSCFYANIRQPYPLTPFPAAE